MTTDSGNNNSNESDVKSGKQSKITQFLPATKLHNNPESKQIGTPIGKRNRAAGLVGVGSPDKSSNVVGKPEGKVDAKSPSKSPEQKRNRHLEAFVVDESTSTESIDNQQIVAVPAFQRFSHLLEENGKAIDRLDRPHLPFPLKYNLIMKLQQALDSAISIALGRGQRAVWHRLVPALQSTTGRTLTMDHLYLLLSFAPIYKTEKCRIVEKGRRMESLYLDTQQETNERERRDRLFSAILGHVEKAHQQFLHSINVVLPKNAELRNWHPKFCLDDVADPPRSIHETIIVANDSNNNQVPAIIKEAIESTTLVKLDAPQTINPQSISKDTTEKKGLSLKERIRLKEQQADLEKMAGPSSSKSKAIVASLPELIDTLSLLFNYSKKSVMFLGAVQERLKQSTNCHLSNEELDERLDCLQGRFPEWITVNRSDAPFTVRINKTISPKALKERL